VRGAAWPVGDRVYEFFADRWKPCPFFVEWLEREHKRSPAPVPAQGPRTCPCIPPGS